MASRQAIPRPIRDKVLAEFNHRCAVCGEDRPHLHHIDEDPSNNDEFNLIPLCPNCHLTDQHNPTAPVDHDKLGLFRRFKDPAILSPQFEPLFARIRFLIRPDDTATSEATRSSAEELVAFVKILSMGQFYADQIATLLKMPMAFGALYIGLSPAAYEQRKREYAGECLDVAKSGRDRVLALVVELLRYQSWPKH